MNDAGGVRVGEGGCNLFDDMKRFVDFQRAGGDFLSQRFAIDELSGNESVAVNFTDFMNRQDVWMIESGSSPCFSLEAT